MEEDLAGSASMLRTQSDRINNQIIIFQYVRQLLDNCAEFLEGKVTCATEIEIMISKNCTILSQKFETKESYND